MFSRLKEDIRCVFDRDPAARNAFEVATTYPGVHAVLFHRLSHRLWNAGPRFCDKVKVPLPLGGRFAVGITLVDLLGHGLDPLI